MLYRQQFVLSSHPGHGHAAGLISLSITVRRLDSTGGSAAADSCVNWQLDIAGGAGVQPGTKRSSTGGEWTVAVMQPYFFPYAGYFRLLASVDEFVIFDCVQFQRRGRIHRTEVPGSKGELVWLTLPLAHCPRETLIQDVHFAERAREQLDERLATFPWLQNARGQAAQELRRYLAQPLMCLNPFLEQGLRLTADMLGIDVRISRSSSLHIPPGLRAQERILAVVNALGATHYVNLPGGRGLYQPEIFAQHGVQLEFLPDYHGPNLSMLHSLVTQDVAAIRDDVLAAPPGPL